MALIRHANAKELARDAIVLDLGDVQRQAELIMEQAKRRAEAMVVEAKAERERILAGATEKGRAEGHAKGLEEGKKIGVEQGKAAALTEWRAKLDPVEKKWGEALKNFEGERDRMLTEARADVLTLAMKFAERVVKRAIEVDPQVVAAQLEAVLAMVARPTEMVVSIHPEDRATVAAALPELCARFPSVRHVELVDNPSIGRGSCVARTRGVGDGAGGGGSIDASIDTQLERIAELILPGRAEAGGHS